VILLHGAGSSHLFWPAEVRRLTGHNVLALDLPGHGHSSGQGFQSVSDFTGAITEFLAGMNIFQAIFVGHSLGSAIALALAHDFPQHTLGIGLVSGSPNFNLPTDLLAYLSSPASQPAGRQMLEELLIHPSSSQHLTAAANLKMMMTARPGVLYGDWLACSRFDFHDLTGKINTPAYVVVGREDRLTPQAQAHFLSSTLPIARLEVIPNAGHLLPLEQPEALAAGLKRFADDVLDWQAKTPQRAEFPVQVDKLPQQKNPPR
jgi:pimeloyl-ACP methyl ester carboxylesterase